MEMKKISGKLSAMGWDRRKRMLAAALGDGSVPEYRGIGEEIWP